MIVKLIERQLKYQKMTHKKENKESNRRSNVK